MRLSRAAFKWSAGTAPSARLDLSAAPVRAFALYTRRIACTKDALAAKRISSALVGAAYACSLSSFHHGICAWARALDAFAD